MVDRGGEARRKNAICNIAVNSAESVSRKVPPGALPHGLIIAVQRETTTVKLAKIAQAVSLVFFAGAAFAQQTATKERIEITGSNIKRIQAEGALPIQIISRQEIERAGISSAEPGRAERRCLRAEEGGRAYPGRHRRRQQRHAIWREPAS